MKKRNVTPCLVTLNGKPVHVVIKWKYSFFGSPELVSVRYAGKDVTDKLDPIALGTCKDEVWRASVRQPISKVVEKVRETIEPEKLYKEGL